MTIKETKKYYYRRICDKCGELYQPTARKQQICHKCKNQGEKK